mgnify:CR=1 FL=1
MTTGRKRPVLTVFISTHVFAWFDSFSRYMVPGAGVSKRILKIIFAQSAIFFDHIDDSVKDRPTEASAVCA